MTIPVAALEEAGLDAGDRVVVEAIDDAEPHHTAARAFFTRGQERSDTRLISAVNLSEVLVAPAAERERLRAAREAIAALQVAFHQPGEAIGVAAARLRRSYSIGLPDAYCLATAHRTGGALASFDEQVLRAARAERIPLAGIRKPRPR